MPRNLTANMITALTESMIRPALLAQLTFIDGNAMYNDTFVWSGIGNLVWNGNTFYGVGTLGTIGTISEDSTVEARNVTINLSGIPGQLANTVLFDTRIGDTCNIWLALFDSNANLVPSPVLSYQGMMDAPVMNDEGQTCSISFSLENILVDLNRQCWRRYTNDDQQIDLAETLTRLGLSSSTVDSGFSYVPDQQEKITFWGVKPSSSNNQ